jgi:UDP-GlcNAc:undecaprenyl-phosphate GlcNAc-1-phosphate transferase
VYGPHIDQLMLGALVLPLSVRLGVGIAVAAGLAYAMTPAAIQAARRFSFYDRPAGYKGHASPTPYLGGAAVMLAFALVLLIGTAQPARTLPLLAGVAVLLVLGTVDDRITVSPGLRVVVEFVLGALLAAEGLGWRLGAGGGLDAAVTGVWVVGVVNAFNLFDNMDGAASTMACVVAGGACALAVVVGDVWVAVGSAALCGACLGFLPHNLSSPARIFLGDGGSLPLGFTIAALVANAAQRAEPSSLALLVGFLLVGVPALDTCLVIVSRTRRGVSVLTGGRDHLTHRTRQRMRTPRRVALVLGGAQAAVSALVILASRQGSSALVYIVLAFLVFAAAAIVALEDAIPAAVGADVAGAQVAGSAAAPSRSRRFPDLCLGVVGLIAGLSPLFSAYYDVTVWVPMGLVVVIAAAMATVAQPPRFTLAVGLALAGVAGLGLWSLLSMGWTGAVERAGTSANLWLTYAALLLLLTVLITRRRHATGLLIAAGVGIAVVAISVLVRMLGSDPGGLFLAGRLNSPLGYINGEGCVFAMGCWMSLALAERRRPILAGGGSAATVALACLALLSQSRGAAIAMLVAVAVALAVIPGFRRRVLALACVAVGVGAAAGPLLHVYRTAAAGPLSPSVAHHAVLAVLLASVVAGLVWGLFVSLANRADAHAGAARALLDRGATAAAILLLAAPLVTGLVRFTSIEHAVSTQWRAFVHLADPAGGGAAAGVQTRLLSGAGNRYDYWRVAWHVFLNHPLAGVGAGNYPEYYFLQRRTQEAIQNPHSIELQTLAELGVIGAVLLGLAIAGVALGARRLRGAAQRSAQSRGVMVAATGVFVVWLVDASGDWMHLLPGVTAIALCAAATLCRAGELGSDPGIATRPPGRRLAMLLGAAGAAFVLAVGGASLLRAGLAQHYLDSAHAALPNDPVAAIADAEQVLSLDSANVDAYYVKAAGQARFDRAAAARTTLLQAVRQDPANFVTWTLLGDLEVRAGDLRAAHAYYGHALGLDPREPMLAKLATAPAGAGR